MFFGRKADCAKLGKKATTYFWERQHTVKQRINITLERHPQFKTQEKGNVPAISLDAQIMLPKMLC
jgi:hypothetical protein